MSVAQATLAVFVQRVGADGAEGQIDEFVVGSFDREDIAARRSVPREREARRIRLADLEEIAIAETRGAQLIRSGMHQRPRRDFAVGFRPVEHEADVRAYPVDLLDD